MSLKKLLLLALTGALALALTAGCGGDKKDAQSSAPAKYLRYVVGAEPETLDPRKSNGMPEARIEVNIFEGLVTHDKDGKLAPGAAEKWTVSPDGKVYTFTIRANAKWSNGEPVTAQDFEYSWKKTLDPAFASKYAQQLYFLAGAEAYNTGKASADQVGVKSLNDKTLEVTLADPCPFFPSVLVHHAYYPVNKKADEANPKWAADAKTIVGNGPFMMKSWTHQSKIETVKNPNYWDAANVKMEQVDYLLTDNNSTALSMFDGNQADLVIDNLSPTDIKRLLKEGKLKTMPYIANGYYCFNVQKAPFDNAKVRKAFSLAIDREAIVKNLDNGYAVGGGFIPNGIPDAEPGSDFRKAGGDMVKFDAAEAKKLLAEAGFPDGKGLPPITLIYNTNDIHKAIAEMIQEMWRKNLGVEVKLENQEWKVFLNNRQTGNYQVARHGWVGDYEDPLTFIGLFQSESGNNDAQYKNPEYDKMLAQSYTLQDPKARMKVFHDLEQKMVLEDTFVAPLYFSPQYFLAKPYVKGVTNVATGLSYFKYAYIE
ncbi:MAG TPA: peptide ABC transporter substrate-binding protein [Selenomonadales bacterium]|nr:peptide ABC transporter substrate-binding protein [Selenomonadales bacterium]